MFAHPTPTKAVSKRLRFKSVAAQNREMESKNSTMPAARPRHRPAVGRQVSSNFELRKRPLTGRFVHR